MRSLSLRVLFLVASSSLVGCSIELQHDLPEDDANEIYVLLQHNGISATKLKEEGGNEPRYIISVPKQDVAAAAQLLKDHSLPRPKADGLAVFKRMKGMIPTQTEERAMFIEALGGEVSNTLNRIPGVLEARAIVMIPEVNDLTQPDKKPQASASVLIKFTPEDGKPPVSETEVREFVSMSVPELKKENVKVLMTEAKSVASSVVDQESRMQSVLGLRMEKASADSFKVMVAVNALLFLALAGVAAFLIIRKPSGNGRPAPRAKPQEG
jgi:type III secretion protein J